ncbi:hypothetical protein OKW34_008793 [Paraburkholderia youngii]|uniref:hypothetical protein n=1 Tax=Paraburkholderia youngii TaxID=2782701 RepID=UPI003D21B4CB
MGAIDNWQRLKSKLAEDIDWLTFFVTPVEQRVAELVLSLPTQNFSYEPLLIEEWFEDLKAILDRCLAYRKEARDLEIAAVQAAVEYQQFCRLADDNQNLEIAALGQTTLQAERDGFNLASAEFKKISSDLAPGFAASMAANVTRSEAAIADVAARAKMINDKWSAVRASEFEYHQRHLSPGNAHNFLERYQRVISLYAQDLAEGLLKAKALSLGLLSIYAIPSTLPAMESPYIGYLDNLVLWVRTVAINVNRLRQEETEYTLVIPLAQPWLAYDDSIITKDDIISAIKPGGSPLKFDLTRVFIKQKNVRIRSLGLCFGTRPGPDTENWRDRVSSVRIRATVHLPEQPPISDIVPRRRRRPTLFANIGFISETSTTEMISGRCCANIDPRGTWIIFLEPLAADADRTETDLRTNIFQSDIVTDIKLVLKVACLAGTEITSAF